MSDVRRMIAKAESMIKQSDPDVIVQATMYDEPSTRLYVTIVKGSRKTDMIFPKRDFDNSSGERLDRIVREGMSRLGSVPIG